MTAHHHSPEDDWTWRAWAKDLHAALATQTRLPVAQLAAGAALSPRARRAYPIIGAFTGLAAGGVFFAGHDVGLPVAVNAVLAVAALILIGGHMDDHGNRAAAPFMVATLLKIASLYVIGNTATPGGGPHMVVLTLVSAGALSNAAAILLAPAEEPDDSDDPEDDPKVVILPPDGTHIPGDDTAEGNGRDLGVAATATAIALAIAALALGLIAGSVAAAGAAVGVWLAPRLLAREIEAETLPLPLALQQSGEVWALLSLAIAMQI